MTPPRHDPERTARLTRRFPDLAVLPEAERFPLMLRARRQPAVLATFFGLLLLWLWFCGPTVIALTNHVHGKAALLTKLFLPALLPIGMIFLVSRLVLRYTIRRLAAQGRSAPPPLPTSR